MNARITHRALAVALGLAATSAATVATADAGAPAGGCPGSYSLLAVADLEPQGYQVPGQVDDPDSGVRSFGSFGNGDGMICALPLGNQTTPWGGQLYQFWDNTLSA